ncbi:MAG: VTT domain-containing protein [Patescibacteria group bacterium]
MEFISSLLNPEHLIMTLGTLGVIVVIFLETGAFFGFFFPGDSLLFTAGYLASIGYVSLPWLLIGAFIAAVVGDSVGYTFGRRVGPHLFNKENSTFFKKEYITRAQAFYEQHGKKTIILARFMPLIRTFAPIVAGIGNMNYRTFLTFNIIGGFVWTWGMLLLGFGLGSLIPNPDRYIIPVVLVIIIVSSLPALKEIFKKGAEMWRKN